MCCGVVTITLLPFSLYLAYKKKPGLGLLSGALGLLTAILTILAWREALYQSGKLDWNLLGVRTYPLAAAICIAMFFLGVFSIVVNLWALIKQKRHRTSS